MPRRHGNCRHWIPREGGRGPAHTLPGDCKLAAFGGLLWSSERACEQWGAIEPAPPVYPLAMLLPRVILAYDDFRYHNGCKRRVRDPVWREHWRIRAERAVHQYQWLCGQAGLSPEEARRLRNPLVKGEQTTPCPPSS